MRIGLTTNAPWAATGYGVQASELSRNILKDGHKIAIMANYGLASTQIVWNNIPVFPQGMETYSNDITPFQIMQWLHKDTSEIGIGMSLYDVWVYSAPEWDSIPMASWTPIDHKGVPQKVIQWFMNKKVERIAIAMSRFGEKELLSVGVPAKRMFYAPHSFNENIFKHTESDIRSVFNIPENVHLTMINSANKGTTPIRKCWPEMLDGWSRFAAKNKDAYLLIWSDIAGLAGGFNIGKFLNEINAPLDRIRVVPQFEYRNGIPQDQIAQAYSASDVLLMTSRGEGFGVPAIEAQACGTPVIVTDWTAQTELAGAGWKVDGQEEFDHYQGGWWKVPNVEEIEMCLQKSYEVSNNKEASKKQRKQAVSFSEKYQTDYVYNTHWKPILKSIEEIMKNERTV